MDGEGSATILLWRVIRVWLLNFHAIPFSSLSLNAHLWLLYGQKGCCPSRSKCHVHQSPVLISIYLKDICDMTLQ